MKIVMQMLCFTIVVGQNLIYVHEYIITIMFTLTVENLGAALLQKLELKTCGQAIWGQSIFGHFGQPVQRVPSD